MAFISIFFVDLGDLFIIAVRKKKVPSILDSCSKNDHILEQVIGRSKIIYNIGSFYNKVNKLSCH